MLDSLKTTLFASLGVVSLAQEKFKSAIDELVQRGELTREQGTKVVDSLAEKGEVGGRAISDKLSEDLNRLINKTPLVSRHEYRALEERLRVVEERLGIASSTTDAAAAPDVVEPQEGS